MTKALVFAIIGVCIILIEPKATPFLIAASMLYGAFLLIAGYSKHGRRTKQTCLQTNSEWPIAVEKRRDWLLNYGSSGECQLFISRLKLQESGLQASEGDDAPYHNCTEDEEWRQSLQTRRHTIFNQKNIDDDEIWNAYLIFSELISKQIEEAEKILVHKF